MIDQKNTAEIITVYDMLFGDLPLSYWTSLGAADNAPWNLFKEAKKAVDNDNTKNAINILNQIINLPGLESRQYLQAYYFLHELEESETSETKIFGVVLEINMPQGNDILAAYEDYTARYYNYTGKSVIWENPDSSMKQLIDDIFDQSKKVLPQMGPCKGARLLPPVNKMARINFLTSKGLHFGETSQQVLFNDPVAGKLMYGMLNLMNALIDKSMPPTQSPIFSER